MKLGDETDHRNQNPENGSIFFFKQTDILPINFPVNYIRKSNFGGLPYAQAFPYFKGYT